MIAATREDPPFHYLENGRAMPPRYGFEQGCQLAGDAARRFWTCGQSLAPDELSRDRLAERILSCRPEAKREPATWGVIQLSLPGLPIHI